jgi:hypothetical protein
MDLSANNTGAFKDSRELRIRRRLLLLHAPSFAA